MPNVKHLRINGALARVDADPERTLLSVLRDDLDLTGTKYGCGEGQCGACTVLIDGSPARACLTRVGAVGDKEITTIEGLASNGTLHPVQEAFLAEGAMQCAYCTSGMIVAGVALLRRIPHPSRAETIDAMDGHICRCGTYPRILAALARAASATKTEARR
jgi:aerobic-type carbon monoxide dehydrogenase small subunit (CoxS/CutS family)